MEDKKQWVISTDGESFTGCFDSKEEATKEAATYFGLDCEVMWIGEVIKHKHEDFINFEDMIDTCVERAMDGAGEHAEDYLSDLTKEDIARINKAIIDIVREKEGDEPSFFSVENIEEVVYR